MLDFGIYGLGCCVSQLPVLHRLLLPRWGANLCVATCVFRFWIYIAPSLQKQEWAHNYPENRRAKQTISSETALLCLACRMPQCLER